MATWSAAQAAANFVESASRRSFTITSISTGDIASRSPTRWRMESCVRCVIPTIQLNRSLTSLLRPPEINHYLTRIPRSPAEKGVVDG